MLRRDDPDFARIRAMRAAWAMTVQRCTNPHSRDFHYYGGRGIKVCDRWRKFENFLADMGVRPEGMTLDRIDVNGNYEPGNCRWATRAQQGANTRANTLITWRGETLCVSEWERSLGMRPGTLKARISVLGYDVETAMTKPVKCGERLPTRTYAPRRRHEYAGPRGTAHRLTRITRETAQSLRARWLAGESFSAMARELSLTVTTVSSACQGLKAYKGVHDVQAD